MKAISIYAVGSCNAETREGFGEVLLEYNTKVKYLLVVAHDTTASRCIIKGLITGVKLIKEPCAVTLVTSTKIGVTKVVRGNGVNTDLVRTLILELQERQCTFRFDVWAGRGEELRSKVAAGRKGADQFSAPHRASGTMTGNDSVPSGQVK